MLLQNYLNEFFYRANYSALTDKYLRLIHTFYENYIQNIFLLGFIDCNKQLVLTNRLLSGAYIGYGIESFRNNDPKGSGNVANYKTGGQLKYYYLKIIPDIYLHAEAWADYDYMTVREKFDKLPAQPIRILNVPKYGRQFLFF